MRAAKGEREKQKKRTQRGKGNACGEEKERGEERGEALGAQREGRGKARRSARELSGRDAGKRGETCGKLRNERNKTGTAETG